MSLDAMRWAKKAKTGRSSAKSVLTWMADMCGADFTTYPSIAALAEATELDKKTVQASLQHLVEIGLIQDTGERRGRTRQIPVYRLVGVEESIEDSERTQKREHYQKRDRLNKPKNGTVKHNEPKNGSVNDGETIPFFPSNDPKNGIRNPPEEPKELNPNKNASEEDFEVEQSRPVPEYPGQPGVNFPAAEQFGKFPITATWVPSSDFRQRVAFWGKVIPEGLNLRAELNAFITYWEPEGKVFHQSQWEQKFANHLQNAKPTKPRGTQNAGLESGSTANAAVQRAHAARAAQLRARGEGMEVLGSHAGNLLQPLGDQKRLSSVGPVDCADWELDQRPDEERL
ncbi:DnaT-like ssDNA-binding domain-containing protein [Klebsiella sp. K822]|uniref:DnaT-like ssDNA-binding domain-containing protein n=1 Tax=unclassified Klebsiella TaxID=2608929 RepID=UPI003C2BD9B9